MGLKPILFGFPCSVVKATMVFIYVYIVARKLPSETYPPFSVTRLPNQNGLSKIQLRKNPNVTPPKLLLKPSPFPFFRTCVTIPFY